MTTIVHKRGTGIPAADDLAVGEIAIDTSTGTAYTKNNAGEVVPVGGDVDLSTYVTTDADKKDGYDIFMGKSNRLVWWPNGYTGRGGAYWVGVGQGIGEGGIGSDYAALYIENGTGSFEVNYYSVLLTQTDLQGKAGSKIFGFDSVQAKDFLDADGNSIIGGDVEFDNTHTDSNNNVYVGKGVMGYNTGSKNTAVGADAGYMSFNSTGNTLLGYHTMYNGDSGYNTAVGHEALYNVGGGYNVAVGSSVMRYNKTGEYNTAIGVQAMRMSSSATNNVAVGYSALSGLDSGNQNVAIGDSAGQKLGDGSANVAVGARALYEAVGNSFNVAIGYDAGAEDGLTNAIAIGHVAKVEYSNTIQLGNSSISSVRTSGVIRARGYYDTDGNPITVSPSDMIDAFTTLQTAVADEDTVEGIKTALTNALGGLIEKFEGMSK
jgi:hypothetical protein